MTYLQVTMNHISRVQVFYSFKQLIHDILLVDVFQYTASFYHIVQVSIYNFYTVQFVNSCKIMETSKTLKITATRAFAAFNV